MARRKYRPVQANKAPYKDNPDMDNQSCLGGILDTLQDGIQDGINKDPENGLPGIPETENGNIISRKQSLYITVLQAISEYEIVNNIRVIDISQLQYNDTLMYIRDNVVIPMHIDIRDIDTLNMLCDIYIQICSRYNKSVSIMGYSYISNIDYTVLNNWYKSNNRDKTYIDITLNRIVDSTGIQLYKLKHSNSIVTEIPNNYYRQILKKIVDTREHSLTDKAENGSVMSLALGKIEYGWIEGRDKQIQADILEQYRKPSDILQNYEQMLLEHDGQ